MIHKYLNRSWKYLTIMMILNILFMGCNEQDEYLRWVGDISFEPSKDDSSFKLCADENQVMQYFNFGEGLQYQGERSALQDHFFENYLPVNSKKTGLIRIRFIVNCRGEIGRFRVLEANEDYEPILFDPKITSQLLDLSRQLKGWKILSKYKKPKDYYQYLIFKIDQGQLKEILP